MNAMLFRSVRGYAALALVGVAAIAGCAANDSDGGSDAEDVDVVKADLSTPDDEGVAPRADVDYRVHTCEGFAETFGGAVDAAIATLDRTDPTFEQSIITTQIAHLNTLSSVLARSGLGCDAGALVAGPPPIFRPRRVLSSTSACPPPKPASRASSRAMTIGLRA